MNIKCTIQNDCPLKGANEVCCPLKIGCSEVSETTCEALYEAYGIGVSLAAEAGFDEIDAMAEHLWKIFEDVPMNPETEEIEVEFLGFPAGTHREEIWHWFDAKHSKGVAYLLYGESAGVREEASDA